MKYVFRFLLCAAAALLGGYCVSFITEYRPAPVEQIPFVPLDGDSAILSDTVSILSWNIGYAGLDSTMDFFYDGGSMVQQTERKTLENLHGIIEVLKRNRDVDFILLQEVDRKSKRTYRMDLLDSIAGALGEFTPLYAANYRCPFVPIPPYSPIGRVESGLAMLTKHNPIQAARYRLPGSFSVLTRQFNLKRCLLEAAFMLPSGDTLWITDVHNSAFDDGSLRRQETEFISRLNGGRKYCVLAGDWNANPPHYNATEREMSDDRFIPLQIGMEQLAPLVPAADYSHHSMRFLNEPYSKGHTIESLIDFAAHSSSIREIETRILDLGFSLSDHNPVLYRFVLSK